MDTKSVMICLLLASLVSACNLSSSGQVEGSATAPTTPLPFPTSLPPTTIPTEDTILSTSTPSSPNQVVLETAGFVVQWLKDMDMQALSTVVHPVDGLHFSPYAYVQDADQVFTADEVANLMSDSSVYQWGNFAGSGEPIMLSFPGYYAKFVYDVDFANAPQVALNTRVSNGNSIDNSSEYYPGSMIVEYYFPGFNPDYAGMDWRSLRLVFTQHEGRWYLSGIIHDEWTP